MQRNLFIYFFFVWFINLIAQPLRWQSIYINETNIWNNSRYINNFINLHTKCTTLFDFLLIYEQRKDLKSTLEVHSFEYICMYVSTSLTLLNYIILIRSSKCVMATLKHICYTYIINNAYSGKISKEHKTDKIWFKWRTWIALACAIIVAACLPACACDSARLSACAQLIRACLGRWANAAGKTQTT